MTQAKRNGEQLGWLLDNLVSRVANIRQALVLSRAGLAGAKSQNMSREEGDHLSALTAGVHSLARGAGKPDGGGARPHPTILLHPPSLFLLPARPPTLPPHPS